MKTIYLTRHAEVNPHTQRLLLSENGKSEAYNLGLWIKQKRYPNPQIIYTSDRPRAYETGILIAEGLGVGIGEIDDPRSKEKKEQYPLELKYRLDNKGIPLEIVEKIQENNSPQETRGSQIYKKYLKKKKNADILCNWEGKDEKVQQFIEFMNKKSEGYDTIAIVSHATILKNVLHAIFRQTLDLVNHPPSYPTTGLTILTKKSQATFRINRLFSVEHKAESQ